MSYNHDMVESSAAGGEPGARASREPGRRMRSHLLDAALALFKARGITGTSVSEIAVSAGAFPSQVTYYFRTKEALFVEVACREVLYAALQTERAASRARSLASYVEALVVNAVAADGLAMFIEALTLARRRQDLAPLIARTVERLHTEGARAYAEIRARRGWPVADDPALRARRFWALVLGVVLRDAASGQAAAESTREILELLRTEWHVPPAAAVRRPRLAVVRSASR